MKSPAEQIASKKGKIVWMSSFPKSGNTWFRCFLSALFEGEIDINKIQTDGIFSSRSVFDQILDIDGRLLDEAEAKIRMAAIYDFHAQFSDSLMWVKVHDAYVLDRKKKAIFPKSVTHKVIYLVRNPLDVVASYANHNACTIDHSIKMMCLEQGYLAKQANGLNINNQLPQLMFSWAGHVNSWLDQKELDVILIRYEDMKKDGLKTFGRAVKKMGFKISDKLIQDAIDLAAFDKLKKAETKVGFKEKNVKSESFFRKGKSGGWVNELTREQAQIVIDNFRETMKRLKYKIPNLDEVYGKEEAAVAVVSKSKPKAPKTTSKGAKSKAVKPLTKKTKASSSTAKPKAAKATSAKAKNTRSATTKVSKPKVASTKPKTKATKPAKAKVSTKAKTARAKTTKAATTKASKTKVARTKLKANVTKPAKAKVSTKLKTTRAKVTRATAAKASKPKAKVSRTKPKAKAKVSTKPTRTTKSRAGRKSSSTK